MATATVTGTTSKIVTGGTASDRLTLSDIANATNSGLDGYLGSLVRQDPIGAMELSLSFNSFFDFTNSVLVLSNAQDGEFNNVRIRGNLALGTVEGKGGFDIHYGPKNIGFGVLIDSSATLSMPNVNDRIRLYSHLETLGSEPGGQNRLTINNNIAGNELRLSFYGVAYTDDKNYQLPSPTGFKPNGSFIPFWLAGPNLTVRDIEIYDGYVDFRPIGDWATPTRGIFVSKTWVKFLGTKSFTDTDPLLFGEAESGFEITVGDGGQTGSYFLHGLYTSNPVGRVVYLNFKGLDWDSQMALFSQGRIIKVENHLVLDYNVIDSFGQGLEDAKIILYKKDPVYASGTEVSFSQNETTIEILTDSTGSGSIGSDTGNGEFICIEAFTRDGNGGNVDGAYANSSYSLAEYASNDVLAYAVIKYDKVFSHRKDINLSKSGEVGEGKQSLGVIQLKDDVLLSELDKSIVDNYSELENTYKLYDFAKAYITDNYTGEIPIILNRSGDTIDAGDYDVELRSGGQNVFDFDGTTVSIRVGNEFTGNITTTGTVTFQGSATINGLISDVNGDSDINATVPSGYENDIDVYMTQSDAEDQINQVASGTSFRYDSAVFGGQMIWFRMTQADGSYIIENYLVPVEAGSYKVNLVVTSENAALGSIKAVTDKIDAMIEVVNGNQSFKSSAVGNGVWSDTATYTGTQKGKVLKDAKDKASLSASLSA